MPLFRELWAEDLITPAGLVHWLEQQPEKAAMRAWVAEEGKELVAFSNSRFRWALEEEGIAGTWTGVLEPYRGQGVGRALCDLAEAHVVALGAHRLESTVREDDAEGRRFATRRGYEESRRERYWSLDVPPDPPRRPLPEGVTVVRLAEALGRDRELFELYDSAERDMPDDHVHTMEFDDWRRETLEHPELDRDLSAVVLVDGRLASFAWLLTDREGRRAANEMTGTHAEFRRRGLARVAKEATIAWAAEAGIRTILTSNDAANDDMLALNDHLGYRPTVVRISVGKNV